MTDRDPTIDPRVEADLRWLFCDAEGDLGMRSSFPAMVARLEVGGRTGGRPIVELDERCLDAASRERPMRRAMEAVRAKYGRRLEDVLRGAFGPSAIPVLLCGTRSYLGVVEACPVARKLHAESRSARPFALWLARLLERASKRQGSAIPLDRLRVQAIAKEAEAVLARAVRAFDLAHQASRRRARRYDEAPMAGAVSGGRHG